MVEQQNGGGDVSANLQRYIRAAFAQHEDTLRRLMKLKDCDSHKEVRELGVEPEKLRALLGERMDT